MAATLRKPRVLFSVPGNLPYIGTTLFYVSFYIDIYIFALI